MSCEPKIYIAIVDDDESLCRSLGRLLCASGMQPVTYLSAEDFLADTKRPKFDCLVLDVQLGGMSGIELQRTWNSGKEGTPVVFITAFDDARAREQAVALGCAGYFRKTDLGSEVIEAIRHAVH